MTSCHRSTTTRPRTTTSRASCCRPARCTPTRPRRSSSWSPTRAAARSTATSPVRALATPATPISLVRGGDRLVGADHGDLDLPGEDQLLRHLGGDLRRQLDRVQVGDFVLAHVGAQLASAVDGVGAVGAAEAGADALEIVGLV